jgi:DNA-binding MarR family transcriptional regulator
VNQATLTADDYRALAEFRYQIRRFLHFSESAARAAGINPQQHQLLLALKGIPESTEPNIGEIARRLHIRHHSAVGLTDRLTQRGLIEKRQGDVDRRRVILKITKPGEVMLRKLSLIHRAQLETEGGDLIRALQKLITHNAGLHESKRFRKNSRKRTR